MPSTGVIVKQYSNYIDYIHGRPKLCGVWGTRKRKRWCVFIIIVVKVEPKRSSLHATSMRTSVLADKLRRYWIGGRTRWGFALCPTRYSVLVFDSSGPPIATRVSFTLHLFGVCSCCRLVDGGSVVPDTSKTWCRSYIYFTRQRSHSGTGSKLGSVFGCLGSWICEREWSFVELLNAHTQSTINSTTLGECSCAIIRCLHTLFRKQVGLHTHFTKQLGAYASVCSFSFLLGRNRRCNRTSRMKYGEILL